MRVVWIILLCFCFLAACDEVVYLRNDEKPVLVLYAVLEAGCDSMRIELTETKGTYDQSPWQRFQEAEVRVYEEGELLGMAEYQPADSSFVLRQPVKAERTYRIEAQVAGKATVWGETHVPKRLENYHLECWYVNENDFLSFSCDTVRYRWQDISGERNNYWLRVNYTRTYRKECTSTDTCMINWSDTLNWKLASLQCSSNLPDPFNRVYAEIEDVGFYSVYSEYIRVEDSGLDGQKIELICNPEFYGGGYFFKVLVVLMHADQHLDAYQKSAIDWQNNAFPFDGEMTWTLHHVPIYSNVHGGAGLVGSYVPMETVLRIWNLDEAEEGAVFGPGERVK